MLALTTPGRVSLHTLGRASSAAVLRAFETLPQILVQQPSNGGYGAVTQLALLH